MIGWSITMSSIVSIDLIHAIARRQHWCGSSGEADIGGVVRVPPLVSGAAIWSVAYDGIPQPRRRWQLSFWRFEPLIFNFFTDTAQLIGNFTISWDLNFHGPAQSVSFSRLQMSARCVSPQIFHGQKARLSRVEAVCGRHLSSCAVVCFFYFFNSSCAFLQVFRGFFSQEFAMPFDVCTVCIGARFRSREFFDRSFALVIFNNVWSSLGT